MSPRKPPTPKRRSVAKHSPDGELIDKLTDSVTSPRPSRQLVRQRTRRNGKYDWNLIREIYVEGEETSQGIEYPTLKQISEKYGVTESRLREHCAAERWREQRAVHQSTVDIAIRQKRTKELAQEAVDFGSSTLRAAKLGVVLIQNRLARVAKDAATFENQRQELDQLMAQGMDVRPSQLRGPIYFEEMRALAQALQTFQAIGRTSLGEDHRETLQPEPEVAGNVIKIDVEMLRDDSERTSRLLQAAAQAGLFSELGITGTEDYFMDRQNTIDAEVVEDTDDEPHT